MTEKEQLPSVEALNSCIQAIAPGAALLQHNGLPQTFRSGALAAM